MIAITGCSKETPKFQRISSNQQRWQHIIQQFRSSGGVLYTFEYASTEERFIVSKIIIGGEGK